MFATKDHPPASNNEKALPPNLEKSLQSLSANQCKWQNQLSPSDKLQLLQEIDRILSHEMSLVEGDFAALGEWTTQTLMGIPLHTDEGQYNKVYESSANLLQTKGCIEKLIEAYQVACGTNPNQKHYDNNLKPQTTSTGHVVLPVFPVLPKHKFDFTAALNVEWWLDVHNVDQAPKPFDLEAFRDPSDYGVLLILGAGNQSFLTLVDVLDALFVRQRTVLVKHHPLRGPALDPICRKLFRPLYEAGYMDSCLNLEDNSPLVYHPKVTAVHMTGGKHTHDAIVWGSSPEERESNLQNNTPKLQAEMTSELGCITPWIMASAIYTPQELQHHANILIVGVHSNASSNCLAPKVVVMDEHWPQRQEFIQLLQKAWETVDLPVAYYPGCQERWDAYRLRYPKASEWQGYSSQSHQRDLTPPLLIDGQQHAKEPVVLPLLCIEMEVDLSTEAGRHAARNEYAFQHEPFCPVLTLVTIQQQAKDNYLETAVELCNTYVYGSLSCSFSVPQSCDKNPKVETAIANLQYGSIGVNLWTGICYNFSWGGYAPVERLDKVQSGIGRIGNFLFVPRVLKSVVRGPSIWTNHPKPSRDYRKVKRLFEAAASLAQAPSVTKVLGLVAAVLGIPPISFGGVFATAAVAGVVSALLLNQTMAVAAMKEY